MASLQPKALTAISTCRNDLTVFQSYDYLLQKMGEACQQVLLSLC